MAAMLEKRKHLDLCISNCTKEKIETSHMASTPDGEYIFYDFFLINVNMPLL